MGQKARVKLESVLGLGTIYHGRHNKSVQIKTDDLGDSNKVVPKMRKALYDLDQKVYEMSGVLKIIDLTRSWEQQAKARQSYLNGTKSAFVAPPGGSFHNAGRAVDVDVKSLDFKDIPKEYWLQRFWDLARPLGFCPIIKVPNIDAFEAWHFDFPGVWQEAYDNLDYSTVAKCAILDIGEWREVEQLTKLKKIRNMNIQAQLIRLRYYEIGSIDGIIGPKTEHAIINYLDFDYKGPKKNKKLLKFLMNCR